MGFARAAAGVFLLCAATLAEPPATLRLDKAGAGVEILKSESAAPDSKGVIARYVLDVPEFEAGAYWLVPREDWYNGANLMRPRTFRQIAGLPDGGFFLLLKLKGGGYLAVLPLAGPVSMAWLHEEAGRLVLKVGNLGIARVAGPFPVAAWARAADPYGACRDVWRQAISTSAHIKPRVEKKLPEFLYYLGFATWEEYRQNYDAEKLVGMMQRIHASGVPIRWIQIGMGHHDSKLLGKASLLNSFEPDPKKFPDGWKPVMAARKPEGIKWLGLFQALSGLVQGVHPQNSLGALNELLGPVPSGAVQPRNGAAAMAFYDAMLAAVKRHGFSFIKMDFEANNFGVAMGTPNPVEAAVNNQRAYQAAVEKHLDGTINCMAHYAPGVFNTGNSGMTRVAQDYKKENATNARLLLYNSYGNVPWAGQTVWGDHDMFHSSDKVSSRMMAVARAMSGGTVYLSDRVDMFRQELILPLCYKDGRILRPLAPAAPLPESLFIEPAKDPYRVVAPLANESAAVVVYNLTEPEKEIEGSISAEDYAHASVMMQPYAGRWTPPTEGLILYDWRARGARRLNGAWRFPIPALSDRFLLMCPVREGWAVIGRTDKYLSPAAVEVTSRTRKALALRMVESGPLAVWSDGGSVVSKDAQFRDAGGGLWVADIPAAKVNFIVRIER